MLGVTPCLPRATPLLPPQTLEPSCRPLVVQACFRSSAFAFSTRQIRIDSAHSASTQRTKMGVGIAELDDFDVEDAGSDFDVEEEGDDADLELSLGEMKRWFGNKPKGFGEGKVYDTSVEERLLEELEHSRKAQLANVEKLKNRSAVGASSNNDQKNEKAITDVPSGFPVLVSNLPKKKNIHRDLNLAFKGFPGIVNISPAVSGNKKTRDPVCKGFAFIYLDSEKAARRFVEVYSNQDIKFGKIEKKITCETKISQSSSSTEFIDNEMHSGTKISEGYCMEEPDGSLTNNEVQVTTGLVVTTHDKALSDCEAVENDHESIDICNTKRVKILVPKNSGATLSPKQLCKPHGVTKKQRAKKAQEKTSKLSVPASAVRLKIKERAVLTGVLSKYSGKSDVAPLECIQR